jgi:Protein of unknown function (DUF2716)
MADDAETELLDAFSVRFSFRPSIDPRQWPSIKEPEPSVTLDLSPTWADGMARDPDELILNVLTAAFPAGEPLAAINYNHSAWWFWPHQFSTVVRESPYSELPTREIMIKPDVFVAADSWPVHPFPNGDYSIILSPDLTSGTFGHPWEQTLCVFGDRLIEQAQTLISYWPVKRRHGGPKRTA